MIKLPVYAGWMRFPIGAFLIFWLCGWAGGLIATLHQVFVHPKGGPELFLIFWIGGWTIGGCFAMAMLYRLLRPPIPEKLTIASDQILYDSGLPPLDFMVFNYRYQRTNPWKRVFQKRRIIPFSAAEGATLKLRDIEGGNRLTIDKDNERFELGTNLTEIEREWLYSILQRSVR